MCLLNVVCPDINQKISSTSDCYTIVHNVFDSMFIQTFMAFNRKGIIDFKLFSKKVDTVIMANAQTFAKLFTVTWVDCSPIIHSQQLHNMFLHNHIRYFFVALHFAYSNLRHRKLHLSMKVKSISHTKCLKLIWYRVKK